MKYQLIFIGYGEAAYHMSKGLASEGFYDFAAYDIAWQDGAAGELIRKRAGEAGVTLLSSTREACESGTYILALTSPAGAVDTAKGCFPWLKAGQIYIDGNSAGPSAMQEIEALPRAEGVLFCDAAAMLPFPKKLHKNPLYLAGEGAEQFRDDFCRFHMEMKVLTGNRPGGASAVKILKSVVMKGLPQLLLESFEAAEAYGVLDTFTEALRGSLDHKTVDQLGEAYLARTLVHSRRRVAEMEYAVSTLEEAGVDASMSRATVHKLELLTEEDWPAVFSQEQAAAIPYKDAIVMISERHKKDKKQNHDTGKENA